MEKLTTLDYSPVLKTLLVNYILKKYEQESIIDDLHLYQEYSWMYDNNELHELFEEEALTNELSDGNVRG
jgi:hypothetical protein